MKIIAIANQKGGVGKTTTAVTLAHGAALGGMRVLLIDLDTQGNCADALRLQEGGDLARWLLGVDPLGECVVHGRDNLDVVRSDKTTAGLKVSLAGMDFREGVLRRALRGKKSRVHPHPGPLPEGEGEREGNWDLVVIDCAPSVDVLHTAALVAADALIIPTRLDQFAIKGVAEMIRSLESVKQVTESECEVIGILPTFYDRVTNESYEQLQHLASAFRALVWPPISQDVSLRVGSRQGRTVWEMDKCKARADYELAVERMVKAVG